MSDDKLDRIENKIDKIESHLAKVDVTLAKQSVSLDEHVKRSTNLEKIVLPLQKNAERVKGALALIGIIAAIAAIIEGIRHL